MANVTTSATPMIPAHLAAAHTPTAAIAKRRAESRRKTDGRPIPTTRSSESDENDWNRPRRARTASVLLAPSHFSPYAASRNRPPSESTPMTKRAPRAQAYDVARRKSAARSCSQRPRGRVRRQKHGVQCPHGVACRHGRQREGERVEAELARAEGLPDRHPVDPLVEEQEHRPAEHDPPDAQVRAREGASKRNRGRHGDRTQYETISAPAAAASAAARAHTPAPRTARASATAA